MIPEIPKRKFNLSKFITDGVKILFGIATAGFFVTHTSLKEKKIHYKNDFMEVTVVFKIDHD